uniref:EF-hand and coiled-coil domain containing 1 n=1 Tax=Sinocyclocheilus grahami TaxID=75366 RepID=A0A672L006_SINGR
MEKSDACDPYSRPARRTQWIVSTLAYHYGLDRGVENEIIVLSTGLDQYLQEIFHHIDCQGDGKIPAEDFNILCEILGLSRECDLEECAGILDNLPEEFSFRQFHAKLCGYFSTKAGCQYENGRLLVGKESEHIETQIRLRSPLRRREKVLSLGTSNKRESGEPPEAEDRITKLEEENASLRELVEDMRAALQSSDARSLALQVQVAVSSPTKGDHFLREVEYIRSSRDGQIEEAMFFNQKLEQELRVSQEAVLLLEECNRTLKKEQVEMRKRVEEARQAVLSGLKKVKELETKASLVPVLQRHIEQLEMELLFYRLCQNMTIWQLTSEDVYLSYNGFKGIMEIAEFILDITWILFSFYGADNEKLQFYFFFYQDFNKITAHLCQRLMHYCHLNQTECSKQSHYCIM